MSSNLAFSNLTSKRYALALYEIAKEKSELEKNENEIKNLKQLLLLREPEIVSAKGGLKLGNLC